MFNNLCQNARIAYGVIICSIQRLFDGNASCVINKRISPYIMFNNLCQNARIAYEKYFSPKAFNEKIDKILDKVIYVWRTFTPNKQKYRFLEFIMF